MVEGEFRFCLGRFLGGKAQLDVLGAAKDADKRKESMENGRKRSFMCRIAYVWVRQTR